MFILFYRCLFGNFWFSVKKRRNKPGGKEVPKALGTDGVPGNRKREVCDRVRRAMDAKGGVCTQYKVYIGI